MPRVIDLCGGFWERYYRSGSPGAYGDAFLTCLGAVTVPGNLTGGGCRPLLLYTDEAATGSDSNGRPAVGYPSTLNPPAIVTSTASDGMVLTRGLDFWQENNYIWFYNNPFLRAEVSRKQESLSGRTWVALWAYNDGPLSTEAAVQSPSYAAMVRAIEYATNAPAFRRAGTVEAVTLLNDTYVIVTSAEVIRLSAGATPAVAVDDEVEPYDAASNAWRLIRLGPNTPTEPRVAVPAHRLLGDLSGDLIWHNTATATVVDTISGKTRIRWALGGAGADVTDFWAAVHARAVVDGLPSLAESLDLRPAPIGQPTAADLPTYVNPAVFLCKNLLRGTTYILETDTSEFGPAALSAADRAAVINKACGPHAAVFEYAGGVPNTPAVLP